MTGQIHAWAHLLAAFSTPQPEPGSVGHRVSSKRISDLLVGVEHDSNGLAEGSGREVSGELGADDTALSVGGGDLTPDGLVVDASLGVLGSVDESNALAVVPGAGLAVLASLDGHQSGVLSLLSLASLESSENSLGVESVPTKGGQPASNRTYLTGSLVLLDFDFVSMSTFNLIFM